MMTTAFFRKPAAAIFMTAFVLIGCRSAAPPIEFYALTPLTAMSEEVKTSVPSDSSVIAG